MSRYVVLLAIAFHMLLVACEPETGIESRAMKHIEASVAVLLESTADDAFLNIGISGTGDFVQMSVYESIVELDFPQVTPRQKQLRSKIETVCSDLGLGLTINAGSDGSEFLDYELPKDTQEIARVIAQVLILVFGAQADTVLEFEANGFDLPAT